MSFQLSAWDIWIISKPLSIIHRGHVSLVRLKMEVSHWWKGHICWSTRVKKLLLCLFTGSLFSIKVSISGFSHRHLNRGINSVPGRAVNLRTSSSYLALTHLQYHQLFDWRNKIREKPLNWPFALLNSHLSKQVNWV